MKYKVFALILALSSVSWAQTPASGTAPANNDQTQSEPAKPSCACCDKNAKSSCADHCMRNKDAKDMKSCCASAKDAKCCGKDGAMCMRSKSDKTASADCKNCCKADKKMSCCSGKSDKSAMNCCGDHCMRHAAATSAM